MGSAQWAVICVLMAALWDAQPAERRGKELERAIIGRCASEAELDLMAMLTPAQARPRLAPRLAPPPPPHGGGTYGYHYSTATPALAAPSAVDLLGAVAQFLRGEVGPALLRHAAERGGGGNKRLAYLARVAANGLDIAAREHEALEQQQQQQQLVLQVGGSGGIGGGGGVQGGDKSEDEEARRLFVLAARQVAIDQPTYATLVSLLREEAEAEDDVPHQSKL